MNPMGDPAKKLSLGWREWVSLPDLGIKSIKAKVDTGAKTCALHAFDITEFTKRGVLWVRFKVHPLQRNHHYTVVSESPLLGNRTITSSGGHQSHRAAIRTRIRIGSFEVETALTRASRDAMGFRMLLGRDAVKHQFLIDPSRSFLVGKRR